MKIVYIEETSFEQIVDEINWQDFLKENKLVILSKIPYASDPICSRIYEKIQKKDLKGDIMYIALGNLAYILNKERIQILNYGPGFYEKDFIDFPIRYYQNKENKMVDSISFYYHHFFSSPTFSIERLNHTLNEIGIRNKELIEFVDINFIQNKEKKIIDPKQRKMIFIPSYEVFLDIEKIEDTLKIYLEEGNFLVLLTFTGNHYGFPFSIDIGDILDTKNYANEYRRLINFFRMLNIEENQVSNFKTSYTGINFRGGCYNFGYSYNNMNEFFEIWVEYIKNKGYNIDEIYFIGNFIHNLKRIREIPNQYLLDHASTADEFNRIVKEKVLK